MTLLHQRTKLAQQAGFVSLTELPNRRLFDDRLEQALKRCARNPNREIALLFMDLDDFKKINDQYGHGVGDHLLRVVATRLRKEVRIGDTVARWAGDEFVAIIEDADKAMVESLTRRLREQITMPFVTEEIALSNNISIGAAFYPHEASSAQELQIRADQRMYEDKAQSKVMHEGH